MSRESALICQASKGDKAAFDALLRKHRKSVTTFVRSRLGTSESEDVVQETFIAAWNGVMNYREASTFRTWLLSIAFRKVTDHLRAAGKRPTQFELLEESASHDFTQSYGQFEAVRLAFQALPPESQLIFSLYYEHELTLAKIADLMQLKLSTLKSRFYALHVALGKEIATYEES